MLHCIMEMNWAPWDNNAHILCGSEIKLHHLVHCNFVHTKKHKKPKKKHWKLKWHATLNLVQNLIWLKEKATWNSLIQQNTEIHFNFLPKPIFGSGSLVVISEETNGSRGHNGENDDGAQYGDYHGLWRDWK